MKHIPQLDGLRAIAVLMVLGTHFWTYPEGHEILNRFFAAGWIGVDLFFVLSGFLITRILLESRDDPHHFRNFYIRRALRIFPAYYLLLAIVFFALPLVNEIPQKVKEDAWMYWLYMGNFAIASGGWQLFLIDITWSLSVEEQFYIVWPALIRYLNGEFLLILCCLVIWVMLVSRWGSYTSSNWMWLHMTQRADGFAAGALVAVAMREGIKVERYAWPVFAGCTTWVMLQIAQGDFARNSYFVNTIGYTLNAAMFASALVLCMKTRVLNLAPLRYVGKVSYGVYLYHPLCLMAASMVLPEMAGIGGGMAKLVVLTLLTVGVASLSFRFYEAPFLRLKDRFTSPSGRHQSGHSRQWPADSKIADAEKIQQQ